MKVIRICSAAALLASVAVMPRPLAAAFTYPASQQQGTISGRVLDAQSRQPVVAAQVFVRGTSRGALTDNQGRYTLTGVAAGGHVLAVQSIGYAGSTREVSVGGAEPVTADFELRQEALSLDAVIVTGTPGGTQRKAIGNVVASINATEILQKSPIVQVDQLLGQRTPGVIMLPGSGQIGEGGSVRIRGISSITQSAEPIVYVDGIRMDSQLKTEASDSRGGSISPLNDINPADIESLEIIKGPAAATLYGTEASNGVIQIITKRGRTSRPQFEVSTRIGTNWIANPAGRTGLRYMRDPADPTKFIGSNIYEREPVFSNGLMQAYNVALRGGTDVFRYYGSISHSDDVGIVSHNWDKRLTARGNVEAVLSDKVSVISSTSFLQRKTRLSEGVAEVRPFRNLVWAVPSNTAARGWRTSPPEQWDKVETRNDGDRVTTSIELRYRPASWFNNRLVAGLDINNTADWTLIPKMDELSAPFFGALALGSKQTERGNRRVTTLDYAGSANVNWRAFSLQPAVGFQYFRNESASVTAEGTRFPAIPITTITGGASRTGEEEFEQNATVGVYVQQQVGWRDRAFVTAAVRADDNSAFGVEFDAAIYPKLSATWVVSEESFWPLPFVEQLRLRGAWGAAGLQPGTFDATRLYRPFIGGGDQPGVSPSSYGNPKLKPERSEELELGFDASLLGNRLNLEFTRYQRAVKDAIIERPLPLSVGFIGSQVVNLGLIHNWGNELGAKLRVLQGRRLGWDVDVQIASTRNEIQSLGEDTDVIYSVLQTQHREGYSIADYFMRRIVSADLAPNGRFANAMCDGGTGPQGVEPGGAPVPCANAPQVWLGRSQPTWQLGVGNSFTLAQRFTLSVRVEGNGGHKHNATEVRATHNLNTTLPVLEAKDPLFLAYRSLENDFTGVYDAGFLRLREISLNTILPNFLLGNIGASQGSITLGLRNVAMLWTAQHGWNTPRDGHIREKLGNMIIWDPETRDADARSAGFQQNVPQTRNATMSVRLSF